MNHSADTLASSLSSSIANGARRVAAQADGAVQADPMKALWVAAAAGAATALVVQWLARLRRS